MEKKVREKRAILTFDKNKARERLRFALIGFNADDIELALYRTEFLFKNELFISEYLKLMDYRKRVGASSQKYIKRKKAFAERWDFNIKDGVSYCRRSVVYGYGMDVDKGTSLFRVDLRYPKTKIVKEFEKELSKYHDDYISRMKELKHGFESGDYINPGYKDEWHGWLKQSVTNEKEGNIPSDVHDYDRYLQIWLMRISGLSWNKIVKEWNGSHDYKIYLQTARNWYKVATKLISDGIPGFLPFPKHTC